ncbi:hypothetical protein UY3_12829 [Chelonia mydas]|uniref:Uncharacterized protein n=1 Tax=Chelonia mydas TaxID=8469 RepID=M7AX23_CHEMY|nr:hypothetical protein UY3_12829 [Chelonia mydas]
MDSMDPNKANVRDHRGNRVVPMEEDTIGSKLDIPSCEIGKVPWRSWSLYWGSLPALIGVVKLSPTISDSLEENEVSVTIGEYKEQKGTGVDQLTLLEKIFWSQMQGVHAHLEWNTRWKSKKRHLDSQWIWRQEIFPSVFFGFLTRVVEGDQCRLVDGARGALRTEAMVLSVESNCCSSAGVSANSIKSPPSSS